MFYLVELLKENYFVLRTWLFFFFLFLEETQRYPRMLGKATPQRSPNIPHISQKQFLGIMLCSKQCGTEHSIHACWAVLSSRRALPSQIWLTKRMALLLCLLQVTNHWSQLLQNLKQELFLVCNYRNGIFDSKRLILIFYTIQRSVYKPVLLMNKIPLLWLALSY